MSIADYLINGSEIERSEEDENNMLIIATGTTADEKASGTMEVHNILNGESCYSRSHGNVPGLTRAAGGLINKKPVICGGRIQHRGYDTSDICYMIDTDQDPLAWEKFATMIAQRDGHAAISLKNPHRLWVLGGYNYDYDIQHSSTEYVYGDSSVEEGPRLPYKLMNTCVVQVDDDQTMLIGGYSEDLDAARKTWVFRHSSQMWREGPELHHDHGYAGCGKMYSAFHNMDTIVVAGGRITEMIDIQNLDQNKWHLGNFGIR